jgi:glycosyltransferase involved in cell wall biosynthesis
LSHARILAKSYLKHEPGARFYLFVLDKLPDGVRAGADVQVIEPEELGYPNFSELCFKYNVTEFSTAVKARLLSVILNKYGEDQLIYFDPDILIARPLEELKQSLASADIVLIPHLLKPIPLDGRNPSEQDILAAGAYNLGFIALRKSPETGDFLRWWEERLRDKCRVAPCQGLFVDQKWIDLAPSLFSSTFVLRDDTYNVAYWNIHARMIERDGEGFLINGRPLAFFHFSGFDPAKSRVLSKHQNRIQVAEGTALAELLQLYADLQLRNGYPITSTWPYGYLRFDNGTRVHSLLRQLYLNLDEETRADFGDPFQTGRENSFFDWATRPRPAEANLSLFLLSLYQARPDVAAAFPDLKGKDREGFLNWAVTQGALEERYDLRLVCADEPAQSHNLAVPVANQIYTNGHTRTNDARGSAANGSAIEPQYAAIYVCAPPLDWTAGEIQNYTVTITNTGCETWNAGGTNPVCLGVHFGSDSDTPHDGWLTDQRFPLIRDLAPGESQILPIRVTAPQTAGSYFLCHRMVKEGMIWFAQIQRTQVNVNPVSTLKLLSPNGRLGGVNVCGYLRNESGLGTAARGYIAALRALQVPLSLKDIAELSVNRSKDHTLDDVRDMLPLPDTIHPDDAQNGHHNAHDVNLVCVNADQHFAMMSHVGEEFFRDHYNIGVWFWELPSFPEKWLDRFPYYDEIWVGTSFIANALTPLSPVPVVCIPPVMAGKATASRERGRRRLRAAANEFVYLFIFDFHSYFKRKNPLALIEAFKKAFVPSEPVRLVIKCVNEQFSPAEYAAMKTLAAGYPISIYSGYWTAAEMQELMAACDAYVSLHRSEGAGLTISEAMSIGKPVIATDWSGNTDFMNVSNSFPIRYKLIELEENVGPYQAGEIWAEPSVKHASELMRFVFEDRAEAERRGEAARREIEANFSEARVASLIRQRLQIIANRHQYAEIRQELARGQFISRQHNYRQLIERIQSVVETAVPADAGLLVVSKGDNELLHLGSTRGWHFPQGEDGAYAGYYPADSAAAIAHLEALRMKGGDYLLFPNTTFWWFDHYKDFCKHLETHYRRVWNDEFCTIYHLAAEVPAFKAGAAIYEKASQPPFADHRQENGIRPPTVNGLLSDAEESGHLNARLQRIEQTLQQLLGARATAETRAAK